MSTRQKRKILQDVEALFREDSLSVYKSVRIQVYSTLCFRARAFDISELAPVSIGPRSTRMPTTLSPDVTYVNVKAKFRNGMRCHKTLSKFAKSLTCGALILWGRSRLQEGTNIYSWPSITCQNGLKQKRSPPMTPELSEISLVNLSSARFGALLQSLVKSRRKTHFCNDQFAKVMLKYGVTHRLSTAYHPQTSGQVEETDIQEKKQKESQKKPINQAREWKGQSTKVIEMRNTTLGLKLT
ncbi:reverse transcriptase domain-containing protein [Tanacetum coccineum]